MSLFPRVGFLLLFFTAFAEGKEARSSTSFWAPRRSLTSSDAGELFVADAACLEQDGLSIANLTFNIPSTSTAGISDVVYTMESDIVSSVGSDAFFVGAVGRPRSDPTGASWIIPIALQAAQLAFVHGVVLDPPGSMTSHSFHVLFADLCDADVEMTCTEPQAAKLAMPVLLGNRLHGRVIPPVLVMLGGDDFTTTLASLAAGSLTPLISYADADQALANRETYPTFMRTNPVIEAIAKAEAAVLKELGLRKVDAFACETAAGEQLIYRLSPTMQTEGIVFAHWELLPLVNLTGWSPGSEPGSDSSGNSSVLLAWEAALQRVLLINGHVHLNHLDASCGHFDFMHWLGLKTENGLIGGGHLWLGVDMVFDDRYNCMYVPALAASQSPYLRSKPFDGYIALDSSSGTDREDAWFALLQHVVEQQDELLPGWLHNRLPDGFFENLASSQLAADTIFLADALFAVLRATNSLALQNGTAVSPADLMEALEGIDFDGISGRVRFGVNGDRVVETRVLQYRMQAGVDGISIDTLGEMVQVGSYATELVVNEPFVYYNGRPTAPPSEDLPCESGLRYNRQSGDCEPCAPGSFTAVVGQASCELCDAGFYSTSTGATRCEVCEPGRFSSSLGVTSCEFCIPGTHQSAMQETACQECLPGTAQPLPGEAECGICQAGTYAESSRSTLCYPCDPGTFTDQEAATQCTPCEAGSYAEVNGTASCELCTLGTYSASPGSSSCTHCGEGKIDKDAWTTMVWSEVENRWIRQRGRSTNSSCTCDRGYWENSAGECIPCGEGLECLGMKNITVLVGYYSAGPEPSVFRCFGDQDRCSGGPPGETCSEGRTSITCAECLEGKTAADGGRCEECVGMDFIPLTLVCAAAFLGMVATYLIIDKSNRATQSHAMLLSAAAVSMLVTVVQQIGVVSTISVEWVAPITDVFKAVRLLNFDISLLRLGCVSDFNPTSRFAFKVLLIIFLIAMMTFIHCMVVLLLYKGRFRARMPSLLGSVGTCFMVCYISIVTTVLGPLQCEEHPNGKWTARPYQSVMCWSSMEHTTMVLIGAGALMIPLGYLAECFRITLRFPMEMRRANTDFLKAYSFLFFRFKAQLHWYVMVLLIRSLLLGLMPVVPNAILQITLIQLIVLITVLITSHCCPWRVAAANALDVCFQVMIVTFVALAAFFVEYTVDDQKEVAWIAYGFIMAVVAGVPFALMYALVVKYVWKSLKFEYFLCHHKAGAGAYTRLLKLCLQESQRVKRDVFVDADNLDNLDLLFSYVHNDTETLVVLASREIFTRPWCVGEMTVARLHQVKVVVVQMPDFEEPSEELKADYQHFVPDLQALASNNIGLTEIVDTLNWIVHVPRIVVPANVCLATMGGLVTKLVNKDHNSEVAEAADASSSGEVAMLADADNLEAEASAQVLRMMILPHMVHVTGLVPSILPRFGPIPREVSTLLLLLSSGCMEKRAFMARMQACKMVPTVYSVLLDPAFRIPTGAQLADLEREQAEAAQVLRHATQQAALSFQPMYASDGLLQVNAKELAMRLQNKVHKESTNGRRSPLSSPKPGSTPRNAGLRLAAAATDSVSKESSEIKGVSAQSTPAVIVSADKVAELTNAPPAPQMLEAEEDDDDEEGDQVITRI